MTDIRDLLPANDMEAVGLLRDAVVELDAAMRKGVDDSTARHLATAGIAMAQVGLYLGRRSCHVAGGDPVALEPGVEVVGLRWYPLQTGGCIGFVGLIDRNAADPYFKVYVGPGEGYSLDGDTARIARRGHPLLDETMARHLVGAHHAFAGLRYEY